jgi:ATP-binding cassette subfamily G (WHITE) protein 2 (PDR)
MSRPQHSFWKHTLTLPLPLVVNTTLYFMSNLRREPGPYFYFLLVGFTTGLSMSMFFRFIASMTKAIAQALAPSSLILMMLILYTGFVLPVQYMRSWASWFRYINPVAYGFENVMVNEFNGRTFACSSFVPTGPSYGNVAAEQRACAVQGSEPGLDYVSGTAYVETAFQYQYSKRWSNYGILVAITCFLFIAHLVMSELVASERSKGEVLVFRRSKLKKTSKRQSTDEEAGGATAHLGEKIDRNTDSQQEVQKQVSIFH